MLLALGLSLLLWYGGMWRDRLNRSGTQLQDVMAALEHVSEPVIMMAGHTISYVNKATLATFGYDSKDELEGQRVTILMKQKDAFAHHSYVDHYEKTGERRVIGKPRGECRHACCPPQPCPPALRGGSSSARRLSLPAGPPATQL
jgi:PAS domain-containing protein